MILTKLWLFVNFWHISTFLNHSTETGFLAYYNQFNVMIILIMFGSVILIIDRIIPLLYRIKKKHLK